MRGLVLRVLLALGALSLGAEGLRAQPLPWQIQRAHKNVKLRGESDDVLSQRVREVLSAKPSALRGERSSNENREWLIHLKGPIHTNLRDRLAEGLGVEPSALKYIPHHTFLVFTSEKRVIEVKGQVPEILWSGPLQPHHKVSSELYHHFVPSAEGAEGAEEAKDLRPRRGLKAVRGEGPVELAVVLSQPLEGPKHSNQTVVKYMRKLKGAVRAASPNKLIVTLHHSAAAKGITWLARQHESAWIEPRPRYRLLNKWSKGIIQSGDATRQPIFDRGITGAGQIIGIADTGIDINLCFFYDSGHALPINSVNNAHRKVISYRYKPGWGNGFDEEGHGSHTTGSLVGHATSNPEKEFNGMAPDAKLVFDDIYQNNDLSPPDDLEHDLFPQPYNLGARVRSESWGGDSMFYTSSAKEVDSFSRNNRGFLVVWAAGNDGDLGMFTIGSPATAKNLLCIGAQHSTAESFLLNTQSVTFLRASATGLENQDAMAKWASFGSNDEMRGVLVEATPTDGCRGLGSNVNGKIAFIQRGTCLFSEKAQHAQAAGAIGMLVYDNTYDSVVQMGGTAPAIHIPCMSISRHDGETIRDMIRASSNPVQLAPLSGSSGPDHWQENLADFSGKGPTGDGRLMPHVVTPGASVWSAKQGGSRGAGVCGGAAPPSTTASVTDMDGTSMAAPVAAGGCALVRQYFTEGWYPTGVKTPANAFEPSGALIRAVVIGSAKALTGSLDSSGSSGSQWEMLERVLPNNQQGYGAMDLERGLYFSDRSTHGPKSLFVADDAGPHSTPCLHTNEAKAFAFNVRSSQRFKVSLAWTDPPASLTADIVLINDLDLTVMDSNGKVWVGNNFTRTSEDGSTHDLYDRMNNHEQVDIKVPAAGLYTVVVHGHHVPEGPQCYSLVATGDFDQSDTASVSCPKACSGHGTCSHGACACDDYWSGPDCSRPIPRLSGTVEKVLASEDWDYYAFDLGQADGASFTLTMRRLSGDGDPDMYINAGTIPEFLSTSHFCQCESPTQHNCECKEVSCDSCGNGANQDRVLASDPTANPKGIIVVGINSFCCEEVRYRLTLTLHGPGCDGVIGSGKVAGCDGVCDSGKAVDACGVCGGDGQSCLGCDNLPNSGKTNDACGVCGGDGSSCVGCDNVPNSGKVLDECGVCGGDGLSCAGCDQVPNSGKVLDECGVCGGDNSACTDCEGVVNGGKVNDVCGVCGGDSSSCMGCDGVANDGKVLDVCGVCDGNGTTCLGCDNVPNSGKVNDRCGVCDGKNECVGCDGQANSGLSIDKCGVCGGKDDACIVCESSLDDCGVCGGNSSTCSDIRQIASAVRMDMAILLSGVHIEDLGDSGKLKVERALLRTMQTNSSYAQVTVSSVDEVTERSKVGSKGLRSRGKDAEHPLRISFNVVFVDGRSAVNAAAELVHRGIDQEQLAIEFFDEFKVPVEVRLAEVPTFDEDNTVIGGGEKSQAAQWVGILFAVLLYMSVGGAIGYYCNQQPAHSNKSPYVAFALWLFFGVIGIHRFYTRTPKVGMLYFVTFGVCGVGWIADLWLQRRYLFTASRPKFRGSKMAERLKNSKIAGMVRNSRVNKIRKYQKGLAGSEEEAEDEEFEPVGGVDKLKTQQLSPQAVPVADSVEEASSSAPQPSAARRESEDSGS